MWSPPDPGVPGHAPKSLPRFDGERDFYVKYLFGNQNQVVFIRLFHGMNS